MLLRTPCNHLWTKRENITRSKCSFYDPTNQPKHYSWNQSRRCFLLFYTSSVASWFLEFKDSFCCGKIKLPRLTHKPRNISNRVYYVRSCVCEINKRTNKTSILHTFESIFWPHHLFPISHSSPKELPRVYFTWIPWKYLIPQKSDISNTWVIFTWIPPPF